MAFSAYVVILEQVKHVKNGSKDNLTQKGF